MPDLELNKYSATAALTLPARQLHLAILTAFVASGRPLSNAELRAVAHERSINPDAALAELASRDAIAFDQYGEVRAAYPFSPRPTAHQVTWEGGPAVYAMCAIDALGISAMIGSPVTITTTEPETAIPVTVEVDHDYAVWNPQTAVVYAGSLGEDCCESVDRTCVAVKV